jgi:hypothetical protein
VPILAKAAGVADIITLANDLFRAKSYELNAMTAVQIVLGDMKSFTFTLVCVWRDVYIETKTDRTETECGSKQCLIRIVTTQTNGEKLAVCFGVVEVRLFRIVVTTAVAVEISDV